ncbi:MAG TPA: thiamine pyrophosphate-binding protein [Myxococcota bacterium]|nr:thiamine pyrophosphate-binding protein [Myxococcota bacterium]
MTHAMKPRMPLGEFLVAYLRRMGVTHLFGLPGDLVLGLFQSLARERELEIVTFSHEPAVGFAADGYARATRKLGVICVTYGAGGNNIVNPIAAAYAERVPLLVISGGPGAEESRRSGIHHMVKSIESQWRVLSEVTCDARILRQPELAAQEIHELVCNVMRELRPGYLEIHRDQVDLEISVPEEIRNWTGDLPRPTSDPRRLSEALRDTVERLRRAERPVLIAGVDLHRVGAHGDFLRLAEKLECAVATTMLGKGVFPMDHPLHLGIQMGPFGAEPIQRRVAAADLVIELGTQHTDINLGRAAEIAPAEKTLWAEPERVSISFHQYQGVMLHEFVRGLADSVLPCFREKVEYCDNLTRTPFESHARERLTTNDLLVEVNEFLARHPGLYVVAESGDMLFGGLELRLHGGMYLAQGYYASMGFGVPAALGAQLGTGVRPLILCGDGAFQMTGMEISHAPRHGLSPICLVVNNAGWGIFRPIVERQELLDVPVWPYAELGRALGGGGLRATTRGELRAALEAAFRAERFSLVEAVTPPDDLSPISRRYITSGAKR